MNGMIAKTAELETKLAAAENKDTRETKVEMKIATTIPLPKPIVINEGDAMVNFKFFKTQFSHG